MKKKPDIKKAGAGVSASFKTNAFKMGSSQVVFCVIAVLIAILLNLIVAGLPTTYTRVDLSDNGYFTLSEQSVNTVKNLEMPVTLYLIAETGSEDQAITTLLDRYEDAGGDNIKVEYVDPVLYPGFTSNYTSTTVSANSVIAVSENRFKVIDNTSIYLQDYSNYYTTGQVSSSFDGEGAITSAIAYVASTDLPVIYALEGHGESTLAGNMATLVNKDNYTVNTLNLMSSDQVPEDCDALMLISPQSDITERELEVITDYLENGGSMIIFSDYLNIDTPNFDTLLLTYGLELSNGIVIEREGANYYAGGYYHYLMPNLESHDITNSLIDAAQAVMLPYAEGISESEAHRSTLNVSPLLSTSSSSYSKPAGFQMTTFEKEQGDTDGPFWVGAAVSEETASGETKLVCFSSSTMLNDTVDSSVSSGNSNLFLSALGWLCDYEQSMSIHAKSVDSETLLIAAEDVNRWTVIMIAALPAAAIFIGAYVTLSRRKK